MLIRQRLLLARKFTDVILIIDQSKVGYWWGFVWVQQKSRSIRILGVIHIWTEERQTRSHSIWVQRTGEIMQFPLVSNLQSSPCTLLLLHQNQLILQHSRTNWQQWLLKALKIISPAIYFLACTCFNQSISWSIFWEFIDKHRCVLLQIPHRSSNSCMPQLWLRQSISSMFPQIGRASCRERV